MNLFDWLIVGHFVGDFLLQTNWMAKNKNTKYLALISHAFVYTLCLYLFSLPAGGISYITLPIIFATHAIIDKKVFIQYWLRFINGNQEIYWLNIMIDQCWHLLIIVLVANI